MPDDFDAPRQVDDVAVTVAARDEPVAAPIENQLRDANDPAMAAEMVLRHVPIEDGPEVAVGSECLLGAAVAALVVFGGELSWGVFVASGLGGGWVAAVEDVAESREQDPRPLEVA